MDFSSSETNPGDDILDRLFELLSESDRAGKPLEVDPFRTRLFDLFVQAHGAGLVAEDADPDLTADGICRELADRWGLREATVDAFQGQRQMAPEQLQKMRGLWSLMRMWMEWSYAWERWPEFHQADRT